MACPPPETLTFGYITCLGNDSLTLSSEKPIRLNVSKTGEVNIMRSRSNSGVKLDNYARMVHKTILCHQVRESLFVGLMTQERAMFSQVIVLLLTVCLIMC